MTKSKSFSPEPDAEKISEKKIIKNVLVLSTVFLLVYCSYNGLFAIQSSLHIQEGLGTASASSRYVAYAASSLFFSPVMIQVCGHKWSISISLFSFLLWIAANGYGVWATMIPASVLNGIFSAPLWMSQGSYLTLMAKEYALQTGKVTDRIITLFFGIFVTFHASGYVIGDVVSNTVLRNAPPENYTLPGQEEIEENCGMNDCPWNEVNITTLEEPPESVVWSLVAVYIIFTILSILVSIFLLDPLPKYLQKEQKPLKEEVGSLLLSVIRLFKSHKMWLLMLFNTHSALYTAFKNADFNRSWVTCSLGIWMVGLVSIPHSIIGAFGGFTCGFVARAIGRVIPMVISILFGFTSFVWLALWTINNTETWVFFTVVSTMAVHDALLEPILQSMHGIIFPDNTEGAYGCYNFFWCLAAAVTYAYNYYVCTDIKLYILFASLALGSVSFAILEWEIWKTKSNLRNEDLEVKVTQDDKEGVTNEVFTDEKYTKF